MICFCHVPKASGTTLHYILRHNFGIHFVEISKTGFSFNSQDLKTLLRHNHRIQAIAGHGLGPDLHLESVEPNVRYIVFLRHPVAKCVSGFNHDLKTGRFSGELVDYFRSEHVRNTQTKFVLGLRAPKQRSSILGYNELERARTMLRDKFHFVGLTEKFDESVLLMRRALKKPALDVRYQRKNVKQQSSVIHAGIAPDLREQIADYNSLDCELYRFVTEGLFADQVKQYGESLAHDVEVLRSENELFQFSRWKVTMFRLGKYGVYRLILPKLRGRQRARD